MARYLDKQLWGETRKASGSLTHIRELIAAGADVNRRGKCGTTPLWYAAYHGRVDIVAALLEAGADPNVNAEDGSGPLHFAANNGHLAVVKQLLDRHANPNTHRGDSGYTPLAAAISHGNAEIVRWLVQAGASVEHRYFGLLMPEYAERQKQPEIAAFLRQSRWRDPTSS